MPHTEKDYRIDETITVTIAPEEQEVYIPFETFDDNITEFRERFSIFLAIPENQGKYSLGRKPEADVFIRDNEGNHPQMLV